MKKLELKQSKTMGNTKYKIGDKVRIKSLDWYNENKDKDGDILCGEFAFLEGMKKFCSETLTILEDVDDGYLMLEDYPGYVWTDEMIESLVERNGKTYPYKIGDRVVLKGNNRCATITDLKYNSWGNLSYYIKIDNDKDISIDYPTELLLPYDNMIEELVEDECPQDFIEKYCKSCDTRCDRTKEYLNGCPYYNAYRCTKQNNAMEEETKPEPKFKVGDILFYRGETCGYLKVEEIREENGEIRYYETSRNLYLVENDPDVFTDKVCSVETEETKPIDFTIKATGIKGKVEVVIPDGYGYVVENDKLYFIKKKKEYPKTYEECCEIVKVGKEHTLEGTTIRINYKIAILESFQKLLICRDAYWKIAGDEMGLEKPWEPSKYKMVYSIYRHSNEIETDFFSGESVTFEFPTAEMRDAFKENFDTDIEICKEFL